MTLKNILVIYGCINDDSELLVTTDLGNIPRLQPYVQNDSKLCHKNYLIVA